MMWSTVVPRGETGTMRVELDKKALFALASDTRVEILRALQPMRRTVTQLAETLEVDKAAVHRHLQKLVEGELVKKYEDHGFVYYGLSWKARDLMSPNENTKIVVLLGSFLWVLVVAVAVASIALWSSFASSPLTGSTGETPGDLPFGALTDAGSRQILLPGNIAVSAAHPIWPILAGVLAAVSVAFFIIAWRRLRRPRQRGPHPEAREISSP